MLEKNQICQTSFAGNALLSRPALSFLARGESPICKIDECKLLASDVLIKNKESLDELPKKSFETRYCDKNSFDVFAYTARDAKVVWSWLECTVKI